MKYAKNILSFLLIIVILAANSQFAIGKMTCLHSGNVEINLGKAVMCDTDDSSSEQISEPCCDLQNYNLIPDHHFNTSNYKIVNAASFELIYLAIDVLKLKFDFGNTNKTDIVSDAGPPPKIKFSPSFLSNFRI